MASLRPTTFFDWARRVVQQRKVLGTVMVIGAITIGIGAFTNAIEVLTDFFVSRPEESSPKEIYAPSTILTEVRMILNQEISSEFEELIVRADTKLQAREWREALLLIERAQTIHDVPALQHNWEIAMAASKGADKSTSDHECKILASHIPKPMPEGGRFFPDAQSLSPGYYHYTAELSAYEKRYFKLFVPAGSQLVVAFRSHDKSASWVTANLYDEEGHLVHSNYVDSGSRRNYTWYRPDRDMEVYFSLSSIHYNGAQFSVYKFCLW